MGIELRPYQQEARAAIHREWEAGRRKTLLVLPTGTGKTIVFSKVIEDCVFMGGRALILAHRGELLDQAADKLRKTTGLGCAVEKADESAAGSFFPVTVGSVQTLMREKRLMSFRPDYFGAVIVDEAHHTIAESYRRILGHFSPANVLGVTATPDRGDMKNLGQYYDSLAYEYTLPRAIKDGYLCRIEAQTIPLKLDLSGVTLAQGDFKASDVGHALEPYLEAIADEMVAAGCLNRKTVVFLPLINTAQKFAEILRRRRFACAEINGESKDRTETLRRYACGDLNVLCNAMLLTEGWDQPAVDCIVVLRPTKIRSLYAQMVGRGTRIAPGKDSLLLLDFLWHTERHELCHPAHLIAAGDEVARRMTQDIEAAGGPVDLEEAELKAESEVVADREAALAKELAAMKHRKRAQVDPVQYALSIEAEDLAHYVPAFGWEMAPATERQRKALHDLGIYSDEIESAGYAAKLLDRLSARRSDGLSTPKQIRELEKRGFLHVGTWQKEAANKLITRISANGWRTPGTINPATYVPEYIPPADSFEPFINEAM